MDPRRWNLNVKLRSSPGERREEPRSSEERKQKYLRSESGGICWVTLLPVNHINQSCHWIFGENWTIWWADLSYISLESRQGIINCCPQLISNILAREKLSKNLKNSDRRKFHKEILFCLLDLIHILHYPVTLHYIKWSRKIFRKTIQFHNCIMCIQRVSGGLERIVFT